MNAAPPKIVSANARCAGIIFTATTSGIAAVIFFFNPSTHHFYPICQFHRLTGFNCPGCGMTRALYALLHGNFVIALHDNALFVSAILVLILRGSYFRCNNFFCRVNGEFFPVKFLWPLLTATLVFTVLRNLPAFAFLAP